MNSQSRRQPQRPGCFGNQALLCAGLAVALIGCGAKPNAAAIELRKTLQDRDAKIVDLDRRLAAANGQVSSYQSTQPALATLPADRLAKLFTTHGIRLGRLTGGADLTYARTGVHDGLKVYVIPFDETGDELKAGGSITVEAFDLAADKPLIGKWAFPPEQTKTLWNGQALLYEYVLPCPWQTPPSRPELTVKVTFTDELTGRTFTTQTIVTVVLKS
jgi:hypothetical protein